MKKVLWLMVFVFLFQSAGFASDSSNDKGYILSRSRIEREFPPELAVLKITIETNDKNPQKAAEKNKEASNKVLSSIKTMLDESQGDFVKTSYYAVSPKYNYTNKKQVLDHYRATNTLTVQTSKIDSVGKFIDDSLKNGATKIGSIHFKLKNEDENCQSLLLEASKKAKNEAEMIMSTFSSSIIGIQKINYSCSPNNFYPRYYSAAKTLGVNSEASFSKPTQIESSNIKITATVNAEFYVGEVK